MNDLVHVSISGKQVTWCMLFSMSNDSVVAKARLRDLEREQSDTWEGVRLRERQYHVCNTLIKEADSECIRCQEAIDELCEYLRPHDVGVVIGSFSEGSSNRTSSGESGTRSTSTTPGSASTPSTKSTATSAELSETERAQTWNEVAAIETEHMHWGRLLTTRCQERASVKAALDEMMKLRRDGRAEKVRLEGELEQISAEIPIVVEVLEGPSAAAEVSRELSSKAGIGRNGCQSAGNGEGISMISLETPAGRTRQAFEKHGWGALTLEEQQWVTLDQVRGGGSREKKDSPPSPWITVISLLRITNLAFCSLFQDVVKFPFVSIIT